jgi:Tfx family DNA-binding protein
MESFILGRCNLSTVKYGLLTDRQKEVLRYRKQGMTQQQVADILGTSKANICTIEKSAQENVRRARETLKFMYTLDARLLCVIPSGTDLLDVPTRIFREASDRSVKVRYDTIGLINRLRDSIPQEVHGRFVKDEIHVYLNDDGEIYFE